MLPKMRKSAKLLYFHLREYHAAIKNCEYQDFLQLYRNTYVFMFNKNKMQNFIQIMLIRASLVAQTVKCLPAMRETWVQSPVRKIPWKRKWQPTPVLLPGKFHGWRSLVGYSPWDRKESDMTEQLHWFTGCLSAL